MIADINLLIVKGALKLNSEVGFSKFQVGSFNRNALWRKDRPHQPWLQNPRWLPPRINFISTSVWFVSLNYCPTSICGHIDTVFVCAKYWVKRWYQLVLLTTIGIALHCMVFWLVTGTWWTLAWCHSHLRVLTSKVNGTHHYNTLANVELKRLLKNVTWTVINIIKSYLYLK